jgi:hypothetical protein
LPLKPRNRPHASDLLSAKPEPVSWLDLIERKAVQNVKVNDRAGYGAVLLQLDANFSIGTIDFDDQPKEEFVGERNRAQASHKNRSRQKHSNRTPDGRSLRKNNPLRDYCRGKL